MPLWIKITLTLFIFLLVPIYWRAYGLTNFLWFSDIALFCTCLALWLESRLLSSMMALGVMIPELVWSFNFFTGGALFGGIEYLFDPVTPGYFRILTLFHIAVPLILLWMLSRLGYDRRALFWQTVLVRVLLSLTYLVTDRSENINWVFGFGPEPQTVLSPLVYLAVWMIIVPVGILLPTHFLLVRFFSRS